MQDKSEGYEKGEIQSYYFIPVQHHNAMRKYAPIAGAIFAREFPITWRGDIDHDIIWFADGVAHTGESWDGIDLELQCS